jgi:hypothetical protein
VRRRGVLSIVAIHAGAGCSLFTDLSGFSGGATDAAPPVADGGPVDAESGAPDGADGAIASTYAGEVMADAPLAYLRLDEAAGAVAKDASGNGNDATVLGTVTWGVPGAVSAGTAVRFDGSTSGLDLGHRFDFAGTAAFTLETWVLEDVIDSTFRHLFTKDARPASGREEYGVFFYDGSMEIERYVGGNQVSAGKAANGIVGRWAHVVATYDGAALAMYVDGVLTESAADARPQLSKDASFYAGARGVGDGVVKGALDEIAIYGTALSAARVKAHFDAARKP